MKQDDKADDTLRLAFTANGWEDYLYWLEKDRKIAKRLNLLINEAPRTPFEGLGKPEALKYSLQGCYSRRITEEHRLVYKVKSGTLVIMMARYHY